MREDFSLEARGNWAGYAMKYGGSRIALAPVRGHNQANEISETSTSPARLPVAVPTVLRARR